MRHQGLPVRARDFVWAAVALAAALYAGRTAVAVLTELVAGEARVGAAIFGALMLLAAVWIALGAWRRTVWGAPPAGNRDHLEMERLDRQQPPAEGNRPP